MLMVYEFCNTWGLYLVNGDVATEVKMEPSPFDVNWALYNSMDIDKTDDINVSNLDANCEAKFTAEDWLEINGEVLKK